MNFFPHRHNKEYSTPSESTVCILFEDPSINKIFAQLLISRGFQPRIVNDVDEIEEHEKIISEANFFVCLDPSAQERCMIVGESNGLENIAPICLTRPLTEEKVEAALAELVRL